MKQIRTFLYFALTITVPILTSCQPAGDQTETPFMKDPHSFSNPDQVRITHLDWKASVDFSKQQIEAIASYSLERQGNSDSLILDTRGLTIRRVTSKGLDIPFKLGESDPVFGSALVIQLPPGSTAVSIDYLTSTDAAALQWLKPEQTTSKKYPFLFTQSQAILARTWIPLQDGPQVRFTYSAKVKVPDGLRALMSAGNPAAPDSNGYWNFEMNQPIPSYLMALAVGKLEFRPFSDRSGVYAEPEVIEKAAYEFADTEKMIVAAEKLYGPYLWDRYDVLVLPPSFPFGGMENPRLTFATPTVIAGDKSLVALIAHELAHSWSGNLVTNAIWDDFWLNEGFTVYFEGRIMEAVYGRDFAVMEQSLGFNGLVQSVKEMGENHPDTHLKLNLAGRDPDEGVSDIAYEKGANFLRVCESAVGRERWDTFLKMWFDTHKFQSVTTDQFIEFLNKNLIKGDQSLANKIRLKDWIFGPGIPDNAVTYESTRLMNVDKEISRWTSGTKSSDLQTEAWMTPEWLYFLRNLPRTEADSRMAELDAAFRFSSSGNSEILAEWLGMSIDLNYKPAFPVLEQFLMTVGRRKFLKPLYEKLAKTEQGKQLALAIYKKARPGYHAVSSHTIDGILSYQ